MKKHLIFGVPLALTALICSCGDSPSGYVSGATKFPSDYNSYVGSTDAQTDLRNYFKMALTLDNLKGKALVLTQVLSSDEVDSLQFAEYFDKVKSLSDSMPVYKVSVANLESTGYLVTPTPTSLKKFALAKAVGEWYYSISHTGVEMREKAMGVIMSMDGRDDRKALFDYLPDNYKRGETDYATWFKNFNNGDYDDISSTIYNSFYHNPESDFGTTAVDMGNSLGKIVAKKGVELIEKSANLEIEVMKAALPEDLVDGIEIAENLKIVSELADSKNNLTSEEIQERILHFVPGYDEASAAGTVIADLSETLKNFIDKRIAKANGSQTESASATVSVQDSDSETPATVVLAVDGTGATTIVFGADDNGTVNVDVAGGTYYVTAVDQIGDKFTTSIDIDDGETKTLDISTTESELLQLSSSSQGASGLSSNSLFTSSSNSKLFSSSSEESGSQVDPALAGWWTMTLLVESGVNSEGEPYEDRDSGEEGETTYVCFKDNGTTVRFITYTGTSYGVTGSSYTYDGAQGYISFGSCAPYCYFGESASVSISGSDMTWTIEEEDVTTTVYMTRSTDKSGDCL